MLVSLSLCPHHHREVKNKKYTAVNGGQKMIANSTMQHTSAVSCCDGRESERGLMADVRGAALIAFSCVLEA